jgi:hypothetical protein
VEETGEEEAAEPAGDEALLRRRLEPVEEVQPELREGSFRRLRSSGLLFLVRRSQRRPKQGNK